MLRLLSASLAILVMASLSASADNWSLGSNGGPALIGVTGWDGHGTPLTPCPTSLVFKQNVACNAVAWTVMGQ